MGVPIVDHKTMSWVHNQTARSGPLTTHQAGAKAPIERVGTAPARPIADQTREEQVQASIQTVDWTLLGVAVALLGIGAVMVYSSSTVIAATKFDSPTFFMTRQLVRTALGLGLLVAAVRMPVEFLRRYKLLLVGGAFFLLLVPQLAGVAYKGAKSWISVPGASFQPSELMKLALIVFLADRLARQQAQLSRFRDGVLPYLVFISIPLGLIVIEPDLGTAVAIALIIGAIMVAAQVRMRHLMVLAMAATTLVALLIWIAPYRLKRLEPGYQIQQGFVALGSGGIFGRGLGKSLQKFFFLPEPYTDSIFPIIGEEFGLMGTVVVLVLFAVFGWRGVRIARHQPTLFGFLLAVGLTANVMVYAALNIAMTTGLIPATGLPLPFISYGGSALVLHLGATGVLLNLSRFHRVKEATTSDR